MTNFCVNSPRTPEPELEKFRREAGQRHRDPVDALPVCLTDDVERAQRRSVGGQFEDGQAGMVMEFRVHDARRARLSASGQAAPIAEIAKDCYLPAMERLFGNPAYKRFVLQDVKRLPSRFFARISGTLLGRIG